MNQPIASNAATLPQIGPSVRRRGFLSPALGLFLLLFTVALVPIAVGDVAIITNTRDRLTNLAVANLRERSTSTANAMDAYVQARRRDIVLVSQLPDVIAYLQNQDDEVQRDAARGALQLAASVSQAYESIAALSLDGAIVAASVLSDEGTNVRFRDYYQNARAGAVYISDPSYSVITNRPALFFSAPVKNTSGLLVGVVRSRLNLTQIWDLVESDGGSVGRGATSVLVDDYGIRLGVSETRNNRDRAEALIYKPIAPIDLDTARRLAADKRFGQKTADQLVIDPLPELRSLLDVLPAGGTSAFSFESRGVEQRGVATRLVSKPWVYVVSVPPGSYTSVIGDTGFDVVGGIVLALTLAALGTLLLPRFLFGSVRRMAQLAEQVSAGRVSPQVSFETLAEDDIGREVAVAFDHLLLRVRQVLFAGGRQG
jgi:C4-dicarboxylate-specific signal transduction histidine kinase